VNTSAASRGSGAAEALLFFSGLAALVYQAIWIKQLTLVVGKGASISAYDATSPRLVACIRVSIPPYNQMTDRWIKRAPVPRVFVCSCSNMHRIRTFPRTNA
jgi:hypothetical protein